MVLVELGVNSSMEEYATPLVLACARCRASRRASVGTNRLVTQRNKDFADAQFTQPNSPNRECYLSCFNRARLTGQVATGFVRRSCFSLVCRTRLDRDFAHGGGYAGLEAHRSHRCAHEQGRLRPWPHRIPTTS